MTERSLECEEGYTPDEGPCHHLRGPLHAERTMPELEPLIRRLEGLGFTELTWEIERAGETDFTIWAVCKLDLGLPDLPLLDSENDWKLPVELSVYVDGSRNATVFVGSGDGEELPETAVKPEAWEALEALHAAVEPYALAMLEKPANDRQAG